MENTNLQLADICDLEKLYKMIGDWSNATGMSAILTDNMGEETMKAWGKSLFCRMLLFAAGASAAGVTVYGRKRKTDRS